MNKIKEIWEIDEEQCKCGIVELYDNIALGICGKTFNHYDCCKIEVGKEVFERVKDYYLEQGTDESGFGMLWVCYGPKANLEGYEISVKPGWASNVEEEK